MIWNEELKISRFKVRFRCRTRKALKNLFRFSDVVGKKYKLKIRTEALGDIESFIELIRKLIEIRIQNLKILNKFRKNLRIS